MSECVLLVSERGAVESFQSKSKFSLWRNASNQAVRDARIKEEIYVCWEGGGDRQKKRKEVEARNLELKSGFPNWYGTLSIIVHHSLLQPCNTITKKWTKLGTTFTTTTHTHTDTYASCPSRKLISSLTWATIHPIIVMNVMSAIQRTSWAQSLKPLLKIAATSQIHAKHCMQLLNRMRRTSQGSVVML